MEKQKFKDFFNIFTMSSVVLVIVINQFSILNEQGIEVIKYCLLICIQIFLQGYRIKQKIKLKESKIENVLSILIIGASVFALVNLK